MKKGRTKRAKKVRHFATGGQVPGFGTDLGGGNFLAPFQQQQQGQGGSLLGPTSAFNTQPLTGFGGSGGQQQPAQAPSSFPGGPYFNEFTGQYAPGYGPAWQNGGQNLIGGQQQPAQQPAVSQQPLPSSVPYTGLSTLPFFDENSPQGMQPGVPVNYSQPAGRLSWNEQTSQWQQTPYNPMAVNQQPLPSSVPYTGLSTLPFAEPPPGSAAANQPQPSSQTQQPAVNQQPQMNMQTLGRFMPYSQYLGNNRFTPYYGPSPSSQGSQDGGAAGGQLGPTGNFSPIGGSQSGGVTGGALGETGNFSPGPGQTGLPGLSLASIGYGGQGLYGGIGGYSFGQQAAPSAQIGLGLGGVNFAVAPTENALTNSVTNQALSYGANAAGGRTGLGLGTLLGMVAPAAGNILGSVVSPVTAAYGMFNQAVNLGTTLANAQGIPTVQQGLQSLQASLTSPSEAGRSVGEQSLAIAQGLMSGQLAESDLAAMNLSPTTISQVNAAMTSQGAVGFADSSSPRGYSGALGMQGPQGASYGLSMSNPSVAQGFASNLAGNPAAQSIANSLSGIFGGRSGTEGFAQSNIDATAQAAAQLGLAQSAQGTPDVELEPNETGVASTDPDAEGNVAEEGTGATGSGSISAGGVANAGNTGVGQANDASTSAAAAAAAASDGGGGGGGGGGGCHAATWSLGNDSRHKDLAPLAKLKQTFFKENPQHAPQLFAMYQSAATQIIQAAQRQGPEVVKQVQGQIRHALVDKTREHMKGKNASSQEAVKNLIAVMTSLAQQLGVQLPGQGGRFVAMGG